MTIHLSIFLIAFYMILVSFIVFAAFNIYHALRFGLASSVNIFVLAVFISGSVAIFGFTLPTIVKTDWDKPLVELNSNI